MSDGSSGVLDDERGWNEEANATAPSTRQGRLLALVEGWAFVAVAVGMLAGMGSFLFAKGGLLPDGIAPWMAAAVVLFAGGAVPAFTDSLREGIRTALAGYVLGIATLTLAWVGPWWVLPFAPGARDLLLYTRLGQVAVHAISSLLLPYFTGYLTVLLVVGYLDP